MVKFRGEGVAKTKVYLDTSIINFLIAEDSPEYRKYTEMFFLMKVENNEVEAYVSRTVIEEISKTHNDKRRKSLLKIIDKYSGIEVLIAEGHILDEILFLSKVYIDKGIMPSKSIADSMHAAYASIFKMDILLSWNFKHLANINKEKRILEINKTMGYIYPFRMLSPKEALNVKERT
jgi:predicted nucleic acid-binding protein